MIIDKKETLIELKESSNTSNKKNTDIQSYKFEKLTYFSFICQSLSFTVSYLIQKIIMLIIYGMYGISSNYTLTGEISLTLITLDLFSSGIRDFQKPISIICAPYYSISDFYNYRVKRNQLVFINTFLYLCFFLIFIFIKSFYRLIGVEEKSLPGIMFQSYLYLFIYKPLVTISNFLQGNNNK